MRILAVGGGSGGHVTPVVAVLREIKSKHPRVELRFWCDKKFASQARAIMGHFDDKMLIQTITAGKLRRYNHVSIWRQLTWPSVVLMNIRDMFLVVIGFLQSLIKMVIWRPDVVFTKGGFVCLPVGLAAKILGIPLVIHDSDAHPGLTNRVLGKWADKIATGAPLEYYSYPKHKSKYVGIPVANEFRVFSRKEQIDAKKKWGIDESYPLVVVTGGGLGASRLNDATVYCLDKLLKSCSVILISGAGLYDELRSITPPNSNRFQLHPFISKDMVSLLGAADLVVARAGATTILELAALAKPTILVPNGKLSGGHQLKNAVVYQEAGAVKVVDDNAIVDKPELILDEVLSLLNDPRAMSQMGDNFKKFAKPNASKDMAKMIISCVK